MGYRKLEPKPRLKNRNMQDMVTPGRNFVHNGATAYFAIPCFYQEIRHPVRVRPHNRLVHDHLGWPNPQHRDRSCQAWDFANCTCRLGIECYTGCGSMSCGRERTCRKYIDMSRLFPIHLTREGYGNPVVEMTDPPAGLVASAWIDDVDDWVVRVLFDAQVESAVAEPVTVPFVVKVTRTDLHNKVHRDIVSLGKLTVLPAPLGA